MTHLHNKLTDAAETATRRFLAPELDGEVPALTEPVDELLLGLAEWADDDPADLPASLHRPSSDALGDIRVALNNAAYRPLYAPDGRYEHEPLTVIELPAATIATYGSAVGELAHAVHGGGNPTVADAVCEFAAQWHRPLTPADLVEVAARVHGVCDLSWGPDEQLIGTRLGTANHPYPGAGIVLTAAEEAAYRRIRDQLVAIWHNYDPLARWLY